ncbi:lipoate--protein ligase family protein [Haloarcula pellucida]|uniref:Lipoprotein lipase n=1 Tax=Haloarcula pellucida TaxID=1427151 RepID=A0A830GRL9_9EURY|nr:biotin/lipoate A/B protein ligase family protein [Halomicroarcula pellucida]MBX0350268.1 lipoate--protein ligase family protein [Halomicroarcula pellucida]GGO01242.1 lipoprotein lipase [Halomicroarcula pellucida]
MTLADLEWRVVGEESHDGPLTMALEEIAAETAAEGGPATVRVYTWPDTLSLGYRQDPDSVDWAFCEREGIGVTRRPTGGGAIYHDHYADLSYGIVAPADAVPGDLMACYELFCEPILEAFERIGVDADFVEADRDAIHQPACYLRALHPAHDVVGPDGRKLAGNAQYRQKDAVIQHGSLSVSTRPERHCDCFAGKPDSEAFRERVGAIDEYVDVDRETVVETLRATLAEWVDAEAGGWTDDELSRARERANSKYASDEWVRRSP